MSLALDLLQTPFPSFDPPIRKVSLSFSVDAVGNALAGYTVGSERNALTRFAAGTFSRSRPSADFTDAYSFLMTTNNWAL